MKRYLLIAMLAAGCSHLAVGNVEKMVVGDKTYFVGSTTAYGVCTELTNEHLFSAAGDYIGSRSAGGTSLVCAAMLAGEIGGLGVVAAKAIRPSNTNVSVEQSQSQEQWQKQLQVGFGVAPSIGSPCPVPGGCQPGFGR